MKSHLEALSWEILFSCRRHVTDYIKRIQTSCQLISGDGNHLLSYFMLLVNNIYLLKLIQHNPHCSFPSFLEDIQIMWYFYKAICGNEKLIFALAQQSSKIILTQTLEHLSSHRVQSVADMTRLAFNSCFNKISFICNILS